MMFTLRDIPLFAGLSPKYLELLQSQMHIHHYNKGSILFYEGDSSPYLQILIEGTVRLYKTTPKGKEVHMHHFTEPEVIALFPALEKIPFPASCEFISSGIIGLIPLSQIDECMRDLPFSISLIKALSQRMKLLATLLHKETVYSSDAKIADLILNNPSIFERLKNNEISSILNMTPETLSRILSRLKSENIISIEQHVLRVKNEKVLRAILDGSNIKNKTVI